MEGMLTMELFTTIKDMRERGSDTVCKVTYELHRLKPRDQNELIHLADIAKECNVVGALWCLRALHSPCEYNVVPLMLEYANRALFHTTEEVQPNAFAAVGTLSKYLVGEASPDDVSRAAKVCIDEVTPLTNLFSTSSVAARVMLHYIKKKICVYHACARACYTITDVKWAPGVAYAGSLSAREAHNESDAHREHASTADDLWQAQQFITWANQ
jgi:hypothetical protein